MAVENKEFELKSISHYIRDNCLKLGENNRFNEKKEYSCIAYYFSIHKRVKNPNFAFKDFCINCIALILIEERLIKKF